MIPKLTTNQQLVYDVLLKGDVYRPVNRLIKEQTGIPHHQSIIRVLESLQFKHLIGDDYKPFNIEEK